MSCPEKVKKNMLHFNRIRFLRKLFIGFFVCSICLVAFLFFVDRIGIFVITNFTDCALSCKRTVFRSFNERQWEGIELSLDRGAVIVKAEQGIFKLDLAESIRLRQILIYCKLTGLSFVCNNDRGEDIFFQQLLAISLGEDQRYADIKFEMRADTHNIFIKGFEADSKDVRIKGSYEFFRTDNKVTLDFKILFSPEIADLLGEDLKNNALALEENNWYSTVIAYQGNFAFLKALYVFSLGDK
ncbi:MAG: hypothetical protein ABH869_04120 [Candidatus Omnitrophota bacterium]